VALWRYLSAIFSNANWRVVLFAFAGGSFYRIPTALRIAVVLLFFGGLQKRW